MPLSEEELTERDSRREIGTELLEAVEHMQRGEVGDSHQVAISPVALARIGAGLSRSQFAELLGVSARTLLEWESGRRQPTGAAKTLIRIATNHPEVLNELIEKPSL